MSAYLELDGVKIADIGELRGPQSAYKVPDYTELLNDEGAEIWRKALEGRKSHQFRYGGKERWMHFLGSDVVISSEGKDRNRISIYNAKWAKPPL